MSEHNKLKPDEDQRSGASPPTARTVAVLEYLATTSSGAVTASEIAERVGVTRSTCRAILSTLVRAGYAARDGSRYRIGRGAIALGRAARERDDLLRLVTGLLTRLNEELSAGCSVTALCGDDLVVIERIGPPHQFTDSYHTGVRLPFVAPFGAAIAASLPPDEVGEWIDRSGVNDAGAERMRGVLTGIASDGYHAAGITDQTGRSLVQVIDELVAAKDLRAEALRHAGAVAAYVTSLGREENVEEHRYHAATVGIPVLGRTGAAELAVVLHFADRCPPPAELHAIGERVSGLMKSVTALIDA